MKWIEPGLTFLISLGAFFAPLKAEAHYFGFVDPFIGTAGTGHATPAACVPFGLVQAGPDTGTGGWDYCSGYRYEDEAICRFSQTHLNGTGATDLGDVAILPISLSATAALATASADLREIKIDPVKKLSETAEPGYYAVTLDGGVKVEIAAAEHASIYRISGKGRLGLLVDCQWGIVDAGELERHVIESNVALSGATGVAGESRVRRWVDRRYGFVVEFDRDCRSAIELPMCAGERAPRYVFDFGALDGGALHVKIGLSADGVGEGSLAGRARKNLEREIPSWDFEGVRAAARAKWNDVLSRATIEGTDEQKRNWYTSLYRLFIQPNNLADTGEQPFYSTFSTWDTFRAAHPLYTILCPERVPDMVDSMLEQGRRTGYLPVWTLWGKENQCMIGTHSIPVIVDWYLKGTSAHSAPLRETKTNSANPVNPVKKDYWLAAYTQIKETLTKKHDRRVKEQWDLLDAYGYYPFDEIKGESVSRTMECAYDDWCAGAMAEKLGFAEDTAFFFKRSQSWKNVFDPSIGLVRGKDSKGNWREPYDPYSLGHGASLANDFTEGNAFQYSWHVMQDPAGLMAAMGGRDAFVRKLDALFAEPEKTEGPGCIVDVTGLIGQYVHGNEPSHHVIYFYPQAGHPEKAAARIREVFDKFYRPQPDGLCGNDDCGQMSAWYIFSAMGFYPFNPCGGEYIVGAPQVVCAKLKVDGGEFRIVARNLSDENKYVKSVTLNGKQVTDWKIRHADILAGGELVFEMGMR